MSRVLAIVDIQQLFLASREEFGPLARVDFVKLRGLFKSYALQDAVVDPIAYILSSPFHDDKRFVRFLKKQNYIVMRKPAQLDENKDTNEIGPSKFKNSSWTHTMVWETIKMLPNYTDVFIVSGNGQFLKVVEAAHAQGKKVTVASFRSSLQKQLAEKADQVIFLDAEYIYDSSAFNNQKLGASSDVVES